MRTMKFLKTALIAAAMLSSAVAQASILDFDLSGAYAARWQLDADQAPYSAVAGNYVSYQQVAGDFVGSTDGRVDIDFFADSAYGGAGFAITDYVTSYLLASGSGVQLYADNTEDMPVFNLGTFMLSGDDGASYTLKISDAAAGTGPDTGTVPEPATPALLGGSLGLLLLARKRRLGK